MARLIWWAALVAGATYMIPVLAGWSGPEIIVWKGAGVTLLALWAALHARDRFGWMIVLVLAFGAAGDVLLDAAGLTVGAVAFAIGHLIAIGLYRQNARSDVSGSQRTLAILAPPLALVATWFMLEGEALRIVAMIYTALVAVMASAAWLSRFPRYRTGIGAMLFLLSDLLIFARESGQIAPELGAALIWPLYFGGQALIAWGVVTTLKTEEARA
jgi:uncharacterized membrane protein YhhN